MLSSSSSVQEVPDKPAYTSVFLPSKIIKRNVLYSEIFRPDRWTVLTLHVCVRCSFLLQVIDSFAERQVAEKLVAEEVPDEDANKSEGSEPDENEEEGVGEEEKDFVDKVLNGEENVSCEC